MRRKISRQLHHLHFTLLIIANKFKTYSENCTLLFFVQIPTTYKFVVFVHHILLADTKQRSNIVDTNCVLQG